MYPIKLKTNQPFIEELGMCEFGLYEDALNQRREDLIQNQGISNPSTEQIEAHREEHYGTVVVDFLDRHKSIIELRNDSELKGLWFALASGTIGLYRCTAANNMLDKFREQATIVDPELVRKWPFNNGM